MKRIQINNFFNNHISLNGKKNNPKPPNMFFEPTSPKPAVFNQNANEQQPQQMISHDTLTPQMKAFQKDSQFSNRKKRTNTIDPTTTKQKQNRKSKEKKSKSLDKFKKTLSLEKHYNKNTDENNQISKTLNKTSKKHKVQKSKHEQYQSEGVQRSKSAILKNTHSKAIQSKQISKQFMKKEKKNIISADSSFKDTKKQIKKQTQNLIKKKQQTQKYECKTARVQSTKIKSKKLKDKIISQLHRSGQKQEKKSIKFLTERKPSVLTASKSYLTSAKQSKPQSAREKRPSKKLFDSKQKDYLRIQNQQNFYQNFEQLVANSADQQDSQVKEALSQLQSALQGVSSKKALAQQLKKFTFKLKNIPSRQNNEDYFPSSQEQSNNDAFKKIKDFKNNLVKKKLNEAKNSYQSKQLNKDQQISKKKSSKKLLNKKKKIENAQTHSKKSSQNDHLVYNADQVMEQQNSADQNQEPQFFKNASQDQSKYINSRNISQFFDKNFKEQRYSPYNDLNFEQADSGEVLNQKNKKYMQFLRSLQLEDQQKVTQIRKQKNNGINLDDEVQKNEDLISQINVFLNKQQNTYTKNYCSQQPKNRLDQINDINPILQRRKIETIQNPNIQMAPDESINYQSESKDDVSEQSQNFSLIQERKSNEIQQLKAFRQQSDQMMKKIGVIKPQIKKKNLSIQLNQEKKSQKEDTNIKLSSSPKYDDRYPHLMKSPKFSDIEITNILAAKQKCLASKHEKMNELVKRMYQKELVSPKSYEYYVYQLKKQYEDQSQGLDGFKEQASEILNEINKQKNDIKAIDELIRQQKWQEARKLMKGQHKIPSVFFGFKKNKPKVFETFDQNTKQDEIKKQQPEKKIVKRLNLNSIQNNINITIKPKSPQHKQINEQLIENELRKIKQGTISQISPLNSLSNISVPGFLKRQQRNVTDSESDLQSSLNDSGINPEGLAKSYDFDFDEKFRLKSNDDLNAIISSLPKEKIQQEYDDYLKTDKADSEAFQHYVYYHDEETQEKNNNKSQEQEEQSSIAHKSPRLKQQGMFKLISVSETMQQKGQVFQEPKTYEINRNSKVIQIDDSDSSNNLQLHEQQENEKQKSLQESGLMKSPRLQQEKLDDSMSENNSLIELELRKGFESNLFFIKQYCISLCEYIRDNLEIKNQFKTIISQPIQFDTLSLLKKYRTTLDGSNISNYNSTLNPLQYKSQFRKPLTKAISPQLAKEFNKTYGPLKFWNVDLTKKGRSKFQMEKQTQAIFLQAILQVLNQSLDFERPGSIFGKPLAWANKSKHLKNMKYLHGQKTKRVSEDSQQSAETYDFIFGVAIARIIQWGSCLCGFLPDTAELQNTQIEEDYVVHIRETRMAFLLEKMLAQQEATFNNSELEQTEVMLYLGKAIYDQLLDQASKEISSIGNPSFNDQE